ncbi:hypothetical protein Tsubulata_011351 [Turnera subulata]|uniref:Enoyl reductase (ER) domain-containing protein n=1 Tax=Turnera subulata TaxID=218843 RepID=A0A9Q0FQS3_9ROSI|nr:hypothetical protein Tsubulata_011351 [Turnera subulata]
MKEMAFVVSASKLLNHSTLFFWQKRQRPHISPHRHYYLHYLSKRDNTLLLSQSHSPPPPPSTSSLTNKKNSPSPVRAAAASTATAAKMVKAIRVHELGGPEVFKWEDVELGEPGEGEIRVKHKAIGINFIDVYYRKGVYKASSLPFTPGFEAAGEVVVVGPGVTDLKVGDMVAYPGHLGAYSEEQIVPADKVVPVPPSIDPVVAASVMLKGMTTQYLVRRTFKVEPGHTILVHAAAGGVGSLLCQWASALGATVIGTVSTKEKAEQAKSDGCHHIIFYKEEDFVTRVKEITSGKGVDVVYDSVGIDTFQCTHFKVRPGTRLFSPLAEKGSLDCLKLRGYMVSFGQSSGTPEPIPLSAIAPKSLFLTRPTLFHYTTTKEELLETAEDVFANIASGVLRVRVNHTYPLSQAAQAHSDLENRKTSGSIVLIP